ncbi:MAG: SDR family oxidoreductase [Chloroflexi bacterium]|nr:SDR family oxidoreductase [Chloroflexota bacterium]
MDDLRGKVALITGGSGGFGRAIGAAFADRGASVALADLPNRATDVERVVGALREKTEACGIQIDVREVASIKSAVDETVATLGSVDIVVCNAGLNVRKTALEVSEADWDAVVDVNLRGVFFSAQAAATQMVRQGHGGKVVSIASIMGLVGSPFGSGVAYCSSKAGVVNMTRALAIEWAEHNINVNAVAPTYVLTPLTEQMFADPARLRPVLERTPMGKLATPEAIADAVVFLASPQADMVTGVTLPVDCGWTAW